LRWGAALAVPLFAFACSSGGSAGDVGASAAQGTGGENGTQSGGNGGATSVSSSSGFAVASSSAAVGTGGFGGGGAFVCDPPAAPGSLYERSAKSYDINDIDAVSLCQYRGRVALIVNTAAA